MPPETIARIQPTPTRRAMAFGVLAGLGAMLVLFSFSAPSLELGWRLVLLLMGAAIAVLADRLRRVTAGGITLTRDELLDGQGRLICKVDDIVSIKRGALDFKPSGGFSILTRSASGPITWAPGLWWRIGRRIGIGGIVPKTEARIMAETLTAELLRRGHTDIG